jgi:predicted PurR-regulated permease PerM
MTDGTGPAPKTGDKPWELRIVDTAIRLGILGLFIWGSLKLVAPFLGIVLWAVILAVAVHPAYLWLRARFGGRGWPAAIVVTLIGLGLVLGPTATLGVSFGESLQDLVIGLANGTIQIPPPPDSVADWPVVGEQVHKFWELASVNLESVLRTLGPKLLPAGSVALSKIASLGLGIVSFAVSVVIGGFLLGPGPRYAEGIRRFARRITSEHGSEFVDLAAATIRNVSRGVIGVSLLQAVLAGIVFALFGVPAAGLLAFLVLILCIVQIGGGLVLIPTVIWAWTSMDTASAAGMTAATIPILLIDNVLKPFVMAKGLKTPMLVIFVGVIGGTISYGLIGLFLGPIVLAVFYELLIAWVGAPPGEANQSKMP